MQPLPEGPESGAGPGFPSRARTDAHEDPGCPEPGAFWGSAARPPAGFCPDFPLAHARACARGSVCPDRDLPIRALSRAWRPEYPRREFIDECGVYTELNSFYLHSHQAREAVLGGIHQWVVMQAKPQ